MDIGKRVRAERKAQGLSQDVLARRADVNLAVINRLERGASTDPHTTTLVAIADALGVPVSALLEEPTAPGGPSNGGRKEREELTVAVLNDGTKYAEEVETTLKAMSDEMPVATIKPLVLLDLALSALYENMASMRQLPTELEKAYKRFQAAVSRVDHQVTQMTHPGSKELHMSRRLFAGKHAERLQAAQKERQASSGQHESAG
jgi:transcriptional regulator with XRE-family HTH domain